MKPVSWLSLFLISIFVLAGCVSVKPTIQPTQAVQIPATDTAAPTSTPSMAVTNTPSPTATQTPLATLAPESVKATMQPLLQDPMNCTDPCFFGITPGKTSVDKAMAFFAPLGFQHREGKDLNSGRDFFSIAYESSIGRDSYVILYLSSNMVQYIEIAPEITKQKEGSPREWTAYSPETLIKKYGKPSRVEFGVELGQVNVTINMILYFDQIGLIALYRGYDNTLQFCPFTYPIDHVRLWIGFNPPNRPQFPTVPLEKATSLTIDQFTQLMLGDSRNACFILDNDVIAGRKR